MSNGEDKPPRNAGGSKGEKKKRFGWSCRDQHGPQMGAVSPGIWDQWILFLHSRASCGHPCAVSKRPISIQRSPSKTTRTTENEALLAFLHILVRSLGSVFAIHYFSFSLSAFLPDIFPDRCDLVVELGGGEAGVGSEEDGGVHDGVSSAERF